MDVSIIIVNYNTLELTKNTIESVMEKTKEIKYEIILVDNASTDGSVEFFESNYGEKIIFIKNDKNLGFGRANNKGIEIAKGKYVFLLNSDTLLINNAVKILYDFMEKNQSCGICGGNLYDKDLKPTHSFHKKIVTNLQEVITQNIKKVEDYNYSNYPYEVECITGADMMIRKNILTKLNCFDEDFFMYAEDYELSYRFLKHNYSIISVPQAKIIHFEGKSSKIKKEKVKMILESKYKYFYKISNLKTCRYLYYFQQIKYILTFIFKFNKIYLDLFKINKEEYQKFLQNYRSLKKG